MNTESRILNELRQAVKNKMGKDISSSSHCEEIAAEIKKMGIVINPQTFRRFFGLIKSSGKFHIYTLDTLAQYCDFSDFATFKKNLIDDELELFLEGVKTESQEFDYWKLSETLCSKIIESPSLLASVHHQLLKYPLARTFFMEHHPMRDLAGTVYLQYFQEYLKYEETNEARLFAYGFLYMGSFLTQNNEFRNIYFNKIEETPLTTDVYILPAGRKFGVLLLEAWLRKDEIKFNKIWNEMLFVRQRYIEFSERSVCSFEYAVLEHIIFTDKTEEMLFLIENNTFQVHSDRKFITQHRKENHDTCWNIMCSMAYIKAKKHSKSKSYLNKVSLDKLALGWKKYYSIMHYFVYYNFADREEKSKIIDELTELIEETHFTYYSGRLRELVKARTCADQSLLQTS